MLIELERSGRNRKIRLGAAHRRFAIVRIHTLGNIFTATIFTDQPVTVSKFKIPKDIAVTGRSFYFQALCEQGFSADGRTTMSFTNVSSIRSQPGNGHSD